MITALLLTAAFTAADWMPLIRARRYEDAQQRCTAALSEPEKMAQAEAHKCLANVVLASGARGVRLDGNAKGGVMGPGYDAPMARKALEHLNAAIELTPHDLSIHQGRLHILIGAGLYGELPKALALSVESLPDPEAIEAWLDYQPDLYEAGQYEAMVGMLRVLEGKFPTDHRIYGNLCGGLAELKRFDEALKSCQKAVSLAPKDPINNFNTARVLSEVGKTKDAEAAYLKLLRMKLPEGMKGDVECSFAQFVADGLKRCGSRR